MFKNYPDWTKIIHKEGHVFIIIFSAVTFLLSSISPFIGWICFVLTIWCAFFFRNPERITPTQKGLVISPADGVVQSITTIKPPSELGLGEDEMLRVSIFLNVFNVHVNRVPVDGKITKLHYHSGRFFNASLDKASIHNERQSVLLETQEGLKIAFVQIAGLIARRIVCDLEEGAEVKAGERFGIIRFGSRLDVYLPVSTVIEVAEGQTAIGGETIIANLVAKKSQEKNFSVR
ncbi:MAG: phosphatidylserine decarboxylase [Rickettsiaceae bacterium]|nr:phosphatidylserine decarboxylase [Rickettsiaceae bacterium]